MLSHIYACTLFIDKIPAGVTGRTDGHESECRHHKVSGWGLRTETIAKQEPRQKQDRRNAERDVGQCSVSLDEGFGHTSFFRRVLSVASRERGYDSTEETQSQQPERGFTETVAGEGFTATSKRTLANNSAIGKWTSIG